MDYKRLLTQVERTLEQIEAAESTRFTIEQIGEAIATNFRDELGITGGRDLPRKQRKTSQVRGRAYLRAQRRHLLRARGPLRLFARCTARDFRSARLQADRAGIGERRR